LFPDPNLSFPYEGKGRVKVRVREDYPRFYYSPLLMRRGIGRGRVDEKHNEEKLRERSLSR
jgi:hypothetical protein